MTVKVTRPEINLRETINQLDTHTYRPGDQVQMVYGENNQTNQNTSSSGAWTTVTTLAVSITPKFTNSLIKAELNVHCLTNACNYCGGGLRRDSTDIGYMFGYNNSTTYINFNPSVTVIDIPGTTNTITYRPIGYVQNGTGTMLWNYQGYQTGMVQKTRITLTEIAQ